MDDIHFVRDIPNTDIGRIDRYKSVMICKGDLNFVLFSSKVEIQNQIKQKFT
jgi:hypothetical protein